MWFEDEAFFGRMCNPVPCWAPRGTRPALPLQRQREYRNVFGAVRPATGEVFKQVRQRNNTELMGEFLAGLSAARGGAKIVLFADGAGWHKSKKLALPPGMRIEILPPRSPELNPAEQLWKHVRTNHTHNRAFNSLADVDAALEEAFESIIENPQTVRSFSCFNWMVYD